MDQYIAQLKELKLAGGYDFSMQVDEKGKLIEYSVKNSDRFYRDQRWFDDFGAAVSIYVDIDGSNYRSYSSGNLRKYSGCYPYKTINYHERVVMDRNDQKVMICTRDSYANYFDTNGAVVIEGPPEGSLYGSNYFPLRLYAMDGKRYEVLFNKGNLEAIHIRQGDQFKHIFFKDGIGTVAKDTFADHPAFMRAGRE